MSVCEWVLKHFEWSTRKVLNKYSPFTITALFLLLFFIITCCFIIAIFALEGTAYNLVILCIMTIKILILIPMVKKKQLPTKKYVRRCSEESSMALRDRFDNTDC